MPLPMPQSVFLFYAASFMPSSLGPLPRGASVRHKDAFKGEATLYLFRYGVGEESGAFSLLSRWSSHYVPLLISLFTSYLSFGKISLYTKRRGPLPKAVG